MRMVILLGCFAIADAINKSWYPTDPKTKTCLGIVGIIAIIMDVVEFLHKLV